MKLEVRVQPKEEPKDFSINFDVDIGIPKKQLNVAKEGIKLISAIASAIESIKNELREE